MPAIVIPRLTSDVQYVPSSGMACPIVLCQPAGQHQGGEEDGIMLLGKRMQNLKKKGKNEKEAVEGENRGKYIHLLLQG